MAIQVLPALPSTGQKAGEAFGGGISKALEAFSHHKLQQMQQRNQWEQTQKELQFKNQLQQQNISKQEAAWEPIVGKSLASLFVSNPKLAQAYATEKGFDFVNQDQQNQSSMIEPTQNQDISNMVPKQTKESIASQTKNMESSQPWKVLSNAPKTERQRKIYNDAQKQQNIIEKSLKPELEKIDKAHSAFKKDKYAFDALRDSVKSKKLTPASTARLYTRLSHNAQAIGTGIGTALGAGIGAISGAALAGVGALPGSLVGGTIGSGIGKSIGSAVPEFVGSPLDQVFKKTVLGFMRNAKDVFGSRIPVAEMQMFLDTLPTLQMDDTAKMVLIDQMESMGKLADDQWEAKNKIIEEHGNNMPKNIMELIEKRTEKQTQEVANHLSNAIKKLIAKQSTARKQFPRNPWELAQRL